MKTQDEILARIQARSDDFFGFQREALMQFLDFETAKVAGLLKDETTIEEWTEYAMPLTEESVKKELARYMIFAWGKAQDHRGISAGRSVEKLTEIGWILRGDDFVAAVEKVPYPQYGAPKLKFICETFGLPIPNDTDLLRMMNGDSCVSGCDEGCGS